MIGTALVIFASLATGALLVIKLRMMRALTAVETRTGPKSRISLQITRNFTHFP